MQPSNTPTTHLSPERLASFDDAPFTADELAHLAGCSGCRAEEQAMVRVVAMAAALRTSAPATDGPRMVAFEQIVQGLREPSTDRGPTVAGVVPRVPRAYGEARGRRRSLGPMLRQAAAVLLLVGGGAALGRMSAGSGAVGAASFGTMRAAAADARPFADLSFASVDEATAVLNEAQRDYERASLWLASNDSTTRDPEVYRARLAALDQMMEASRVALRDAPQDPVLNHYYLAAYSAREATLQALGGALPVDKTIERY